MALAVLKQRPPHESAEDGSDQAAAIRHQAEAQFDRLRRRHQGAGEMRLSMHVLTEDKTGTGRAICDYAAAHGFDLLVLGRHGDGGGRRPRLGHVASAAAHDSQVPVLLLSAE